MKAPTATATLQRPSKRVQLAVWTLLLLVLALGAGLVTTGSGANAPLAESAEVLAANSQILAAEPGGTIDPVLDRKYYRGDDKKDIEELLPAYRWSGALDLYDALPSYNVVYKFLSGIASFFFLLSGWIWWVLLLFVSIASSIDLVRDGAAAIDGGFAAITSNIWQSGIVMILLVFACLIGVKLVMKGSSGQAIGVILALAAPVAFMQGLTIQIDPDAAKNAGVDGQYTSPSGSPSWLAIQALDVIDSTAHNLGSGFGTAAGASDLNSLPGDAMGPSCVSYRKALYNQYDAFNGGNTPNTGSADQLERAREANQRAAVRKQLDENIPVTSYLWERAAMQFWVNAQLGSSAQADRISCHMLEDNAETPADEQAIIAGLISPKEYPKAEGTDYPPIGVFDKYRTEEQLESEMLAWAACTYDGNSWAASNDAWGKALGDEGPTACADWWAHETGDMDGHLEYGTAEEYGEVFSEQDAGTDVNKLREVQEAHDVVSSLRGDSAGSRFLNGIMSFITSLAYAWALIPLAAGATIAQLGAVLLLILLPATLVLFAIPTSNRQRHPAGKKLLRMTGAFLAAKLVLTVVLTLLISAITVFTALMAALAGGASTLSHIFVPIAALFLIRYLLKQVGLGDITSLSGSLGMASAGAIGMGGDANGRGGFSRTSAQRASNRLDKAGERLGINRADAFAKKKAAAAAKAIGKGSAKLAAKPAKNLAASAALGDRARRLLGGPKDENGNRAQLGLVQQLAHRALEKGYGLPEKFGALADKVPFARGAANAARKLPGAAVAAGHLARLKNKHGDRAELAQRQRDEMREHIQATKWKSAEGRLAAAKERHKKNDALGAAHRQMLGMGINSDEEIKAADLQYDPTTGQASFLYQGARLTAGPRALDQAEIRADHLGYADAMKLHEHQVVPNQVGLGATYIPVPRGRSATAQLVQAKTLDKTKELARDGMQYVPDELKVRRPGESDDQYSARLYHTSVAIGAVDPVTGRRTDFAKEHGIDLDTEVGMAELQKCLNGQASKFDALQGSIQPSARQQAAIIAHVSRYGRAGDLSHSALAKKEGSTVGAGSKALSSELKTTMEEVQSASTTVQSSKFELTQAVDVIARVKAAAEERSGQVRDVQVKLDGVEAALARAVAGSDEHKKLSGQKVSLEANLEKVTEAAKKADEDVQKQQAAMHKALGEVLDNSLEAIAGANKMRHDAKNLELDFKIELFGRKGKDLLPIMEEADKFEKEVGNIEQALQNRLLVAQEELRKAYEEGNDRRIRAAADSLERLVKREVDAMTKTATDSIGYHVQIDMEEQKALQEATINALRYGSKAVEKQSSADVVGAGAPFPRS